MFSCSSFLVPVKDKKLMDVKLGELPGWILMRDFTPKGIAGAFQRGQSLWTCVNKSKYPGLFLPCRGGQGCMVSPRISVTGPIRDWL